MTVLILPGSMTSCGVANAGWSGPGPNLAQGLYERTTSATIIVAAKREASMQWLDGDSLTHHGIVSGLGWMGTFAFIYGKDAGGCWISGAMRGEVWGSIPKMVSKQRD